MIADEIDCISGDQCIEKHIHPINKVSFWGSVPKYSTGTFDKIRGILLVQLNLE